MDTSRPTRGFITIATGKERYYQLAQGLLHSYRIHSRDDTPFAILCDRENQITREFDHTVIMPDCSFSYMDKLQIYKYSPYDETIFIDADALFVNDPAPLWEDFQNTDFSCYGNAVSADSNDSWFDCNRLDDLSPYVSYGIRMHGGLYFLRKGNECGDIFTRAHALVENFSRYGFLHCHKPADEPVLALSMAVQGLQPCSRTDRIAFYAPAMEWILSAGLSGRLLAHGRPCAYIVFHAANINTRRFLYRYLLEVSEKKYRGENRRAYVCSYLKHGLCCLPLEIKAFIRRSKQWFLQWSKAHLPPSLWAILRRIHHGA